MIGGLCTPQPFAVDLQEIFSYFDADEDGSRRAGHPFVAGGVSIETGCSRLQLLFECLLGDASKPTHRPHFCSKAIMVMHCVCFILKYGGFGRRCLRIIYIYIYNYLQF